MTDLPYSHVRLWDLADYRAGDADRYAAEKGLQILAVTEHRGNGCEILCAWLHLDDAKQPADLNGIRLASKSKTNP